MSTERSCVGDLGVDQRESVTRTRASRGLLGLGEIEVKAFEASVWQGVFVARRAPLQPTHLTNFSLLVRAHRDAGAGEPETGAWVALGGLILVDSKEGPAKDTCCTQIRPGALSPPPWISKAPSGQCQFLDLREANWPMQI
jgi:hypothetical protein